MKKYLIAAGVAGLLILAQTAASAGSGAVALLNDSDSSPAKAAPAESASVPATAERASAPTPASHTIGSADRLTDAVEATVLPAGSAGRSETPVPDRLAVPAPAYNAALSSATQDGGDAELALNTKRNLKITDTGSAVPAVAAVAVVVAAVVVASDSAETD